MTIIAVKDGVMASDTGVFSSGRFCGTARKWSAVPDHKGGGFVGAAGSLGIAQKAVKLFAASETSDFSAEAMIWLRGDGAVFEKYGEEDWLEHDAPFYAIGSGEDIAAGAMAAGATAAEAVQICIDLCSDCGGNLEVAE